MCHILEQDTTINSEQRTALIISTHEGYEEKYHAYVNAFQQRHITDYFCQHQVPQLIPEPVQDATHHPTQSNILQDIKTFINL